MTIDELIERSHAMAVEKGWWPCSEEHPGMATLAEIEDWERKAASERSVAEQVNNFHAEISEAWEEWRAGRMELWFSSNGERVYGNGVISVDPGSRLPSWKPEGFWVEIADLCIRLADTMGAMGWKPRPSHFGDFFEDGHRNVPRFIGELHRTIDHMTIGFYGGKWNCDSADKTTGSTIEFCISVAKEHGVDLLALCELKMQYNATRPARHGGKRA